jgi:hypothetical protein
MVTQIPVHGLDPESGTDGQVPVIAGGKFVIGDQTGGTGSPLIVKDEGTEVEPTTSSMDFTGAGVTATSDGSGHVTVDVSSSAPTTALVPLTTVVAGEPSLIWDGDNQLVMTEVPL